MLKKMFFSLFLIICFASNTIAAPSTASTLSKLEDATLGVDYPTDKTESRLNRLEKNIYGKTKTGSVQSRLDKLSKDIAGDVIGQEIKPTKDTFMEEEDIVQSDGTENYPIIDEIEKKLFTQSYPEKSLHSRMVGIEKKLFNKTFDTDDYYTRMERIKAQYYEENPPIAQSNDYTYFDDNSSDYMAYNDTEPDLQSYYSSPHTRNYSSNIEPSSNLNSQDEYLLMTLEKKILRNTYPNQSYGERLSRLENKVFETDFFYDDAKIRMDRLASATKAKASSQRYDNNRFYSKMNTAMSIGSMLLMILAFVL